MRIFKPRVRGALRSRAATRSGVLEAERIMKKKRDCCDATLRRQMEPSADASRKRPAAHRDEGELVAPPVEPAPRKTLCDVVQLVAMNGFADAVVRCVCVCTNMRTNVELWERIVDLPHRDVDVEDADYRTTSLIHWAAQGDVARVRDTLGRGANVTLSDSFRATALHHASKFGHLAVVRELLDCGADVDARERARHTALAYASGRGHTAVVLELAARGADVNVRSAIGATPLILACRHGHAATAAELLRVGADVNARNYAGTSALMWAVTDDRIDAVRLLLAAPGVDVNVTNVNGRTALSVARDKGRAAVVALLEAAGAR